MYIWKEIRKLKNEGNSIKKIARILKLSKNTVRKYLRQESPPKYSRDNIRASQWEIFKEDIKKQSERLIASVIYENLTKKGATGSRSSFYEYFKKLKKEKQYHELSMRYETLPGEQGQFDWSEYMINYKKTGKEKVYIIRLILGHSRYRFNVASKDVTQLSLFQAMELAFQYFRGVPRSLLIDNPKQLITNPNRKNFTVNKHFDEFASYYRFKIQACQVRRAQTKGKVERPFHYLENHFIKNNEFEDFEDLSSKLLEFTEKVNHKYHSGIGQIPFDLFKTVEEARLQKLPKSNYFETFNQELRKVDHVGTVKYKGVSYSVPVLYSNKQVRIEPCLGYKLRIYSLTGEVLTEHLIKSSKGGIVVKNEHYEPFLRLSKQDYSKTKQEFLELFPGSEEFVKLLQEERKTHYLSDLSKILQISNYYSKEDVLSSFQWCVEYNSFSYKFVHAYLQNHCTPLLKESQVIENTIPWIDKTITTQRELNYYDELRS
jgi:transposase